jgi:hypothetical protein
VAVITDWPGGKQFAFTVFDDTDFATLDNVGEVYRLLADLGFRTTKSVWPLEGTQPGSCPGQTCEDPAYLNWLLGLRGQGFEIGYHTATWHTSVRKDTLRALDRFEQLFGRPPAAMANHSDNQENVYWGTSRLGGLNRFVYNLATGFRYAGRYRGHVENDPLFWGDLCKEKIRYCRSFVFNNINTLAACPFMPYHDSLRPYVNYWFASSEGSEAGAFNQSLSEKNQDKLESEGGACIMYAHFACGFVNQGKLNPRFKQLMERLARKGGWYVPVSTLLDRLAEQNSRHVITNRERTALERRWLGHKLLSGRP